MSTYRKQKKSGSDRLTIEIKTKEKKVRDLLVRKQLDGIIIGQNCNFAWLTAGGNNKIVNNRETGAAEILITNNNKYILTNTLEEKRLQEEEVGGQDFTFLRRDWYQKQSIDKFTADLELGSDLLEKGVKYVGQELAELRYSLTDYELERYRLLGQEVAEVLTESCRKFRRGMTENEAAGLVAKEIFGIGAYPVSLLIAADERIAKYSHPQPTDKKANNRLLISLAAQRAGQIVSLTRLVSFGSLADQVLDSLDDLMEIERVYLTGTEINQRVGELFTTAINKYQELGYDTEWKFDDHGGALGYKVRDYLATEECEKKIKPNQPFAWTPTLPGLKLEDTVVATQSGPEVITCCEEWPVNNYKINGKEWSQPKILAL